MAEDLEFGIWITLLREEMFTNEPGLTAVWSIKGIWLFYSTGFIDKIEGRAKLSNAESFYVWKSWTDQGKPETESDSRKQWGLSRSFFFFQNEMIFQFMQKCKRRKEENVFGQNIKESGYATSRTRSLFPYIPLFPLFFFLIYREFLKM